MMRVEFPKRLRRRMMKHLFFAGRKEIGGVLLAKQIEPGWFQLEDFTVDKKAGTSGTFIRHPEEHEAAIDNFLDRNGDDYERYNYLGEWHSHPSFSVDPSVQDIYSMQTLLEEEPEIGFATLLIVKLSYLHRLDNSATLFQRNMRPSQVEIVRS